MSTSTPTPNEDTPRQPSDPADGRNDPAIDPDGKLPPGTPGDGGHASHPATDNAFSPGFEPEAEEDSPGVAKDADIDTDGG